MSFNVKGANYIPRPSLRKGLVLVSSEHVRQFLTLLQKAAFGSMSTPHEIREQTADWVLEGAGKHSYHVVARSTPESRDYEQACRYLIDLSPVKMNELVWGRDPY